MRQLIDFIYPSFCIFCQSKAENGDFFCFSCVNFLNLEMDDSIMHVLEENPITLAYVKKIKSQFPKKHIKTLAAFVVVKYFKVFEDIPDYIFATNSQLANSVAKYVAKILKKPFKKSIKTAYEGEDIILFSSKRSIRQLKLI